MKASRYTASSSTDFAGARFWIGSKKISDERIYVVKTLGCTFFDDLTLTLLSNKSCTNFSWPQKTCIGFSVMPIFPEPKITITKDYFYCKFQLMWIFNRTKNCRVQVERSGDVIYEWPSTLTSLLLDKYYPSSLDIAGKWKLRPE